MECFRFSSSSEDFEKEVFKECFKKLTKSGFSRQRSLKAIASTGVCDERIAGQWLTAHVDDVDLDKDNPRDYYIFLCPNGRLSEALMKYWKGCKKEGLWGQAQEYSPHITIIPRFQLHDSKVADLHMKLRNRIMKQPLRPQLLSASLDVLCTSDPLDLKKNFIGYQAIGKAKSALESFSNSLLSDLDEIGILMEESVRKSRKGIYHLSLSYGFSASNVNALTSLMEKYVAPHIKDDSLDKWRLCLYSCDIRYRSIDELFKMKISMKNWELNDSVTLAYNTGDLIGLLNGLSEGVYGTGPGINCSTGLTGTFVLENGDRVPIYYAWTPHRQWPLEISVEFTPSTNVRELRGNLSESNIHSKSDKSSPRRLFVMRHGERIDFCFRNWISKCFDNKGIYRRSNLNMPAILPHRKPELFFHDSPLTMIGTHVALETGVALKNAGVIFTKCYSSSALRCVQTATHCLRGLGQESLGICLEPLLFEWMGWYKAQAPSFMTAEQLKLEGLAVNMDYIPLSRASELKPTETPSQYYERKGRLVRKLLDVDKRKGGTILIVGHAASLDVCTRPLVSKTSWPPQISEQEFHGRSAIVPFCGLIVAEERTLRWHLVEPPILPFSHCKNADFNWQQLILPH